MAISMSLFKTAAMMHRYGRRVDYGMRTEYVPRHSYLPSLRQLFLDANADMERRAKAHQGKRKRH